MLMDWIYKKAGLRTQENEMVYFDDFFQRTLDFLKPCGSEPYLHNFQRDTWKTVIIKIYYIIGLVHLDLLGLGECVIFKIFITDPEMFLIATTMAPCIIFICGLTYKEYVLWKESDTIYEIYDTLRAMFPDTLEKQAKYRAQHYCFFMQKVELTFIASCCAFTTTFSLMPIFFGLRELLIFRGTWDRVLPYTVWYPFGTSEPLLWHVFLYIIQMHAAFLAGVCFMGADLMMCAAIAQHCMHLDYISRAILDYKPKGVHEDVVFLGQMAKYHGIILE